MIQAKGKLKRKQRQEAAEEQAELEKETLEKIAKTVVRKSSDRQSGGFPTRELRNVIADTFERTWEEIMPTYPWRSEKEKRINAEDRAIDMVRLIKYGNPNFHSVKITDHEYHPPKCREHRKGG